MDTELKIENTGSHNAITKNLITFLKTKKEFGDNIDDTNFKNIEIKTDGTEK